MSCFAFLSKKRPDSKSLSKAAAALDQNNNVTHIASNFNDKRLVFNLFSSAENGRLSKDELKGYLKQTNLDKADDLIRKKVEEVTLNKRDPIGVFNNWLFFPPGFQTAS
jgi:hypothetical protein